jgi:protein O-GlcNAc transferase
MSLRRAIGLCFAIRRRAPLRGRHTIVSAGLCPAFLLIVALACTPQSTASSRSGGEGATSSSGGDEIMFPDEAEEAAAPPASPEVAEAENTLAEGRPREARTMLEAVVAAHADDLRAWLDLGLAREMLDDIEGAEQAYRSALAANPQFTEAMNNLGTLLRDTDRLADGIAMLRQAIEIRPGFASAHLNLGLALEDSGDDAGAAAEYRTVMRLAPQEPTSRTQLGLLLLRGGDTAQALIELRRALPLADDDRPTLSAIGSGLRRAGDPAMAVRALNAAIEAEETPAPSAVIAELALAEFAAGSHPAAETRIRGLITSDPDYASAHYLLANMLAARQAWTDAASEYQAFLRAAPSAPEAVDARGRLTYVQRQH